MKKLSFVLLAVVAFALNANAQSQDTTIIFHDLIDEFLLENNDKLSLSRKISTENTKYSIEDIDLMRSTTFYPAWRERKRIEKFLKKEISQ